MREHRKLFHILFLVSYTVLCEDSFGMRITTEGQKPKETTQYRFRYFVKDDTTGDYKLQEETKEGDSVHGSYTIAEPNGDLRTVTYKAGPGKGFEAKVNVQPNASPVRLLPEPTNLTYTTPNHSTEKPRFNVKHSSGGFAVDVRHKPEQISEMNFSIKTNAVTKTIEESTVPTSIENATGVETTEVGTTTDDMHTLPMTGGRDANEDPVEKEIEEALNSMPKLPELVLPDNKTHLKFHKDPEEALLDERISQIARQLAETSLRREYEERKLGHVIPISVTPITNSRYLFKSFKLRPSEEPVQVLNHVNLVPHYIYGNTQLPTFVPFDRMPIIRPGENLQMQTPDFLKVHADDPVRGYNTEPIPVMPIQVPTFLQFFSPYMTSIRTVPQQTVHQDSTESISLVPDTTSTQITATQTKSFEKP